MFKEMHRKRQQLSKEECIAILEEMTSGVLALNDRNGYPYAVPLSYVYSDNKIYFHSAIKGHKIDLLKENRKVSFCVIGQDHIVSKEFTTYFRSVIVFGQARILIDEKEKMSALQKLGEKYSSSETSEALSAEINKGFDHLLMIEVVIEHMTGKEAIELKRTKKVQ